MEKACQELEEDIEALEKEATLVLEDIKATVGDLSDLRYGKFNRVSGIQDDMGQDTVQSLRTLENICSEVVGRVPEG
jgi:centromere-localized protein 2